MRSMSPSSSQPAAPGMAIISSVTTHLVFAEAAVASIPMLSIVQVTCDEAVRRGPSRPGLLSTRRTSEGAFFAHPFEAAGIELVRPSAAERAEVDAIYFGELLRGQLRAASRTRLVAIIETMAATAGIDGLILGGTELPLILTEPAYACVPVLDATAIHVARALDWMLGSD